MAKMNRKVLPKEVQEEYEHILTDVTSQAAGSKFLLLRIPLQEQVGNDYVEPTRVFLALLETILIGFPAGLGIDLVRDAVHSELASIWASCSFRCVHASFDVF